VRAHAAFLAPCGDISDFCFCHFLFPNLFAVFEVYSLSAIIWYRNTSNYSAAVTTLSDTARTYSDYSGPRGGVAASTTLKISVMMMMMMN